jgi:hypothetical protein
MIIDLFKTQIEKNVVVTEELLNNLNVKQYNNGEEIKVGDKILYALLQNRNLGEKIDDNDLLTLTVIVLKEEHFDLYTYDERMQDKTTSIPTIILKTV